MKKTILLFCLLCQGVLLSAQDLGDATRYGMDHLDGTARFVAMGGAFGALGGDLSSLKINPAGSAVFRESQVSWTVDISDFKNKTSYNDGSDDYHNNKFDLNQAGILFVMNNDSRADITRLNLGITYDRNGTYKNRFNATGNSNETVGNHFLNLAQGVPLDLLVPTEEETVDDLYAYLGEANEGFNNNRLQTAYLGYEAFLFDAVDESDFNQTDYISNVTGNSFTHYYRQIEKGLNGKVTFNAGLSIRDRIFLGLNLNSHFIDYRRVTQLDELAPDTSEINEINYDNYLDTKGSGFSFQVGGIAKLDDTWRVGLSYESPTWLRIEDQTTQYLRSYSHEFDEAVVNPQVTNIYPTYQLRTPGQLGASIAAVIGNSGLISFDYAYKDFGKTKFRSAGFDDLNEDIADNLKQVNTFRLGGEYRIDQISLRAGVRYQDSPYQDKTIGDLKGYSAGIGYDFGGARLDFAYDLAQRDYQLPLLDTGFTHNAHIKNTLSHYVLTLVFNL